jgi:hypothetical protein
MANGIGLDFNSSSPTVIRDILLQYLGIMSVEELFLFFRYIEWSSESLLDFCLKLKFSTSFTVKEIFFILDLSLNPGSLRAGMDECLQAIL